MLFPVVDPASIAHTIQLAVAPVFMLAGIGSFLNVLAGRLVRVVDRARVLEASYPELSVEEREHAAWELKIIDRRMRVSNNAVICCTASGALIGVTVAALFVSQLLGGAFGRALAVSFVLSMLLFVAGLVLFLAEIRLAIHMTEIRVDRLANENRWLLGRHR